MCLSIATELHQAIYIFAAVMKQKKHLPFFGIGPFYVALIVGLTVFGMVLSAKGYLGRKSVAAGTAIHLLGSDGRNDETD